MADPTRAAQLVQEDAYSARGIDYNERAVGDERLLFDGERGSVDVDRQPLYSSNYKGKGRSEDGEEDDMAWEPPGTPQENQRRRLSDQRQFAPASAQHQQHHAGHARRGSAGGSGLSTMEKRRIRLMWWKAAGINVLFILAWYTFSTVISVYSESCSIIVA